MIKALIFDCFGVLYRDNISLLYDAVPIEKHQALQDIIRASDYGYLTREEYYQGVAELAGKNAADIREIEKRQHVRDEQMIAYSQTFRSKYQVGLLSNIDSATIRRYLPDIEQLFDGFIISGDVGVTKPSQEIFELMAMKLGLRPEECLMIDDLPKNIEGAESAGMRAVLFTSRHQLEQDLAVILTPEGSKDYA